MAYKNNFINTEGLLDHEYDNEIVKKHNSINKEGNWSLQNIIDYYYTNCGGFASKIDKLNY